MQYAREEHPSLLVAHPDGWLTVYAEDELDARRIVCTHIGGAWAFIYEAPFEDDSWQLYPRGELHQMGRVSEPAPPAEAAAIQADDS